MAELTDALQQKGVKVGLRKQYTTAFARMAGAVAQAEVPAQESQAMLAGTFGQLNAEFGFSLQVPAPPSLDSFKDELARIEQGHSQYLLGVGNAFKLAQSAFAERLGRALTLRLHAVLESAAQALDLWSTIATAQLDAQLRERQRSFARRRAAMERIQEAAAMLRLEEMGESHAALSDMVHRLHTLMQAPDPMAQAAAASQEPTLAGLE